MLKEAIAASSQSAFDRQVSYSLFLIVRRQAQHVQVRTESAQQGPCRALLYESLAQRRAVLQHQLLLLQRRRIARGGEAPCRSVSNAPLPLMLLILISAFCPSIVLSARWQYRSEKNAARQESRAQKADRKRERRAARNTPKGSFKGAQSPAANEEGAASAPQATPLPNPIDGEKPAPEHQGGEAAAASNAGVQEGAELPEEGAVDVSQRPAAGSRRSSRRAAKEERRKAKRASKQQRKSSRSSASGA